MTEGTKIGEYKDNQEFSTAVRVEDKQPEDMTATKMGKVSGFESSETSEVTPQESQKETQQERSVAQKKEAEKSEKEPSFLDFETVMQKQLLDYQEGDTVKGIVRSVEKGGVFVDISYKSDGFISNSEYSNDPGVSPADTLKPGDEIFVTIEKLESKEGYTILSRRKAEMEEAWNEILDASKNKTCVQVYVSSQVQGGLVASYKGIKGFIPSSQMQKESEKVADVSGKYLEVVVLQADRRRRKVIFSQKLARAKQQKEAAIAALDSLEVGEIKKGRVTSIKDFGVFVDIGGIEGLVHISELSWSRVKHPSDLVKIGDDVQVFVLGVDKTNSKISLGIKQLKPDPWVEIAERYTIGQVIEGTITRLAAFGAFIKIEENLEGLIHISELSYDHVKQVEDVVNAGDVVKARIIKLIPEEQKIGLSLKGLDEATQQEASSAQETVAAAPQETVTEETANEAE